MNSLQDPFKQKKIQNRNDGLYKVIIGILILVIIAGGVYLFVIKPRQASVAGESTESADTAKYNALIDKVKKIILVPDENPTIATIANLEEVQKQNATFYADAKEGDTVIIFSTKALIYREGEDKIINVAPVTKEADPTTQQ
ncbi:MAG: hypothetical protein ABIM99_06650 [Candidatus Dojkabacteria bacterium]